MINAEIFSLISGQKQYFVEQKLTLHHEINKLIKEKTLLEYQKDEWKDKYNERFREIERLIHLNQEFKKELISKELNLKVNQEVQTELDFYEINQMQMNSQALINSKELVRHFLYFTER